MTGMDIHGLSSSEQTSYTLFSYVQGLQIRSIVQVQRYGAPPRWTLYLCTLCVAMLPEVRISTELLVSYTIAHHDVRQCRAL